MPTMIRHYQAPIRLGPAPKTAEEIVAAVKRCRNIYVRQRYCEPTEIVMSSRQYAEVRRHYAHHMAFTYEVAMVPTVTLFGMTVTVKV